MLIALGVTAIATAGRISAPATDATLTDAANSSGIRSLVGATVVGLTNPKVYIIFAALLPTFVDSSSSVAPALQMAALALVPVFLGLAADAMWAIGASWARGAVVNAPSRRRLLARIDGGCLIAVGGYTALHRG